MVKGIKGLVEVHDLLIDEYYEHTTIISQNLVKLRNMAFYGLFSHHSIGAVFLMEYFDRLLVNDPRIIDELTLTKRRVVK